MFILVYTPKKHQECKFEKIRIEWFIIDLYIWIYDFKLCECVAPVAEIFRILAFSCCRLDSGYAIQEMIFIDLVRAYIKGGSTSNLVKRQHIASHKNINLRHKTVVPNLVLTWASLLFQLPLHMYKYSPKMVYFQTVLYTRYIFQLSIHSLCSANIELWDLHILRHLTSVKEICKGKVVSGEQGFLVF